MNVNVENFNLLIKTYQYEIFLGLCALFLAYFIAMLIKKARSNFPPGPTGLPIVGYLLFMTSDIHLDLMKLGKKYGDVYSIKLGSQNIVILHGSDAIKEAFNKPEFLGAFFSRHFHLWKEQRRFVVQSMKRLGFCKTKIEDDVMGEINHFMDVLRSYNSLPIDVKDPLCSSMSNNICALVFGRRFEYDDPDRQFLGRCLNELFEQFTQISLDEFFPWLHYIPFVSKFPQGPKLSANFRNFSTFFQKEINEHLKTFDSSHMRDFMDRYLLEIDVQRAKNPDTTFNHDMLISNAMDLFIAGSETVRTSLLWFIYFMAAFPDVQKKIQEEIMEVIGSEKTPEYMDMPNMPYTHAVMIEIMRWKVVLPLSLVHCTLADSTVGGYSVPKGTTVVANLWAVHHDTRYWDEPEKFKPERFISKDGKAVVKSNHFMPFSIGGRVCPGESMAYLEMFLYFTSILREFDIEFPDRTKPTVAGKYLVTYKAEPYLVRFIPKD